LPNDDKIIQEDIKNIELEIQKTCTTNTKALVSKQLQPILTRELCEDDDVILKPVKTTIYENKINTPIVQQENVQTHSYIKKVCNNDKLFINNEVIMKENNTINNNMTSEKVFINTKNIKKTILQKPISSLEFERTCNSLKDNPNLAREYINSIEIYKYPTLFKESLSASIMQCFIYILRKGFMPNEPMVI